MGTIFSWSVPWQEGRAEKHGAGRGAGRGEGKKAGIGVRKGQGSRKNKEVCWPEKQPCKEGLGPAQTNRGALGPLTFLCPISLSSERGF